ncbi:MAG: hypothetical protein A3J63_04180 [Candidatus Moranbacteria bacterium RIFCSPHIGHO2_02_FULL_40_12b]|nr:MAG: hypothetical protein A3J63_04180 [Candidatus Moranbacteria bacterium RIFCSPHIGHO2_02_FULL_40_12b]OGI23150.1 MAG: hypothetical protein A3E91_03020 [Candidatus Moranbacteria bacterium RIFCSPHIGHO2_12_FULL_40_10]
MFRTVRNPAEGAGNLKKIMKINKEWHLKNRMPKNPALEQRIKWHKEHAKFCACREMPAKLKAEIKKLEKSKK